MKNSITALEVLLVENLDNRKMQGFPFKKLVAQPKETVNGIYEYIGMGLTYDVEQAVDTTLNDNNTPKMVKFVFPDEWFTCNRDEIGKRFHFYQDTSGTLPHSL